MRCLGNAKTKAKAGKEKEKEKASLRFSLTEFNVQIAQNLLEELYDDYAFLRDLEKSPTIRNCDDPIINSHISSALDYLEQRLEFFRTKNPKMNDHETDRVVAGRVTDRVPDRVTDRVTDRIADRVTDRVTDRVADSRILKSLGKNHQILPKIRL